MSSDSLEIDPSKLKIYHDSTPPIEVGDRVYEVTTHIGKSIICIYISIYDI